MLNEKNLILEINRFFFLSILSSLSKITISNKINNKYSLINVFSNDDEILFSANNDYSKINISVKKDNKNLLKIQKGKISVSCRELTEIINNIQDENVLISSFENILEINGKKTKYHLNISENNDDQKIIIKNSKSTFKLNNIQLLELINQTSYINSLKDDLISSCINIQGKNNTITALNVSKYRISKKQIKINNAVNEFKISVSAKSINDIIKIFENKNEEINISINNEKIFFYTKNIIVSLVLAKEEFPDIQKILDKKFNYSLIIKNKKITPELEGVCIISNRKVRMNISEKKIIFSMCDNDECSGSREIDSDFQFNGEFKIEFNGYYVLEVLKILKNSEDIIFQFDDKNKPFLIKNIEGDSLHLIAPIASV